MLDTLVNWFKNAEEKQEENSLLKQNQKEAKLDALLLMMFIDRHVAELENEMLKFQSEKTAWSNPEYHYQLYVDKTIAKIRNIIGKEEELDNFIQEITQRLENQKIKQELLETLETFMEIDAEITPTEKELLEKFRGAFL